MSTRKDLLEGRRNMLRKCAEQDMANLGERGRFADWQLFELVKLDSRVKANLDAGNQVLANPRIMRLQMEFRPGTDHKTGTSFRSVYSPVDADVYIFNPACLKGPITKD